MKNNKNEFVKPGGLDLKDRLVSIQRVTKVTKGGRAFGFTAIVVVGDENGVVGHGLGKSKDVATSIAKAIEDAKKNLVKIPLYKGTLPHEQKGKHGGTGKGFNWDLISSLKIDTPIILSGGLNHKNIVKGIEAVQPSAIDVNSGVEISPGLKDADKIKSLFQVIKNTKSSINPFQISSLKREIS